jgi:hypothetical protein
MKRGTSLLFFLMLAPGAWSQGHPEASAEKSVTIQRSSEYSAEGPELEKKVPVQLHFGGDACAARLSLEYYQKNANAHVTSTLENDSCGASSGSYVLRIRFRRDSGESEQIEFEETWARDDAAEVVTEKIYPVGDELQITRIGTARLRCYCAGADTAEDQASPQAGQSR